MRVIALLATAVLATGSVSALCGNNQPLCGEADRVVSLLPCREQRVSLGMEPCCGVESLSANECAQDPVPTCRSMTTSGPIISGDGCCNTTLSLNIRSAPSPDKCCKTCSCFGDPHCVSFAGQLDTWVLCDGRVYNPEAKYGQNPCPVTQTQCKKEKDHLGAQCRFSNKNWVSIPVSGSPCKSASEEPAQLVMYRFPGFEVSLEMGERGIITEVAIRDENNHYYLDSELCIDDKMPWRDTLGGATPPADPKWLPYSWERTQTKQGVRYLVAGLNGGVTMTIQCLRYESKGKKGHARINIEALGEPQDHRADASGFCVSGEIDKGLATTSNTDKIYDSCRTAFAGRRAANVFCNAKAGVKQCAKSFCKSYTNVDSAVCEQQLETLGWEHVWCAYNTLTSMNPEECTSGTCQRCTYDIFDFGWTEAIDRYANSNQGGVPVPAPGGHCVRRNALLRSLKNCESGVTLQYYDSTIDAVTQQPVGWTDYLAIPNFVTVCPNELTFHSGREEERILFTNRLRVQQCNKNSECPGSGIDECAKEPSVVAELETAPGPEDSLVKKYMQLIREGKVICNPARPDSKNNPMGCFPPGLTYKEKFCDPCLTC